MSQAFARKLYPGSIEIWFFLCYLVGIHKLKSIAGKALVLELLSPFFSGCSSPFPFVPDVRIGDFARCVRSSGGAAQVPVPTLNT